MRFARSLHLCAIAAFASAVIALILGEHLVATIMFTVATVAFLALLILPGRR